MAAERMFDVLEEGTFSVVRFRSDIEEASTRAGEVYDGLVQFVGQVECLKLAIDLTDMKYVPSSVLGIFARLAGQGIEVHLVHASPDIVEVLEVTRLNRIMHVNEIDVTSYGTSPAQAEEPPDFPPPWHWMPTSSVVHPVQPNVGSPSTIWDTASNVPAVSMVLPSPPKSWYCHTRARPLPEMRSHTASASDLFAAAHRLQPLRPASGNPRGDLTKRTSHALSDGIPIHVEPKSRVAVASRCPPQMLSNRLASPETDRDVES